MISLASVPGDIRNFGLIVRNMFAERPGIVLSALQRVKVKQRPPGLVRLKQAPECDMSTWIVVLEAGTAVLSFATTMISLTGNTLSRRKTSPNTEIEDSNADS